MSGARLFGALILIFVTSLLAASPGRAQNQSGGPRDAPSDSSPVDLDFIGIQGHYRAGYWTAVRIDEAPIRSRIIDFNNVILETTDGDGVIVKYEQHRQYEKLGPSLAGATSGGLPSGASGEKSNTRFGYCVPGTEGAPLNIRAPGADSDVILRTRFPESGVPADGPSMIPLGMPWAIVIGDPLGIDKIGVNELLDRNASVAVTRITDPRRMPDHVLGLSAVDLLLITGTGEEVLRNLSPPQADAIANWVRGGGRVIVTLGESAKTTLAAAKWLAELLPDSVVDADVVRLDPSGLETFTSSQTRLSGFSGLRLPRSLSLTGGRSSNIGETLIAGRTARRITAPLASRYAAGMGKITVIAADLDRFPFIDWSERFDLITKLADRELLTDRGDASSSIRLSGFSDLSGQLRRSLDSFSIKRGLNFSLIALVIAALVILVAPLDYFIVRRWLGNPLLGWLTFPIVAIIMSVGLVIAAKPQFDSQPNSSTRPEKSSDTDPLLQTNSIEMLDLDTSTGTGRLFRWSFLYSHEACRLSIDAESTAALAAITDRLDYRTMRPFGAPDIAMGGIQIDSWNEAIRIPVTSTVGESKRQTDGEPTISPEITSRIDSLEIAPRGSKSFSLSMQFESNVDAVAVKRRSGSELLQGGLSNPLDVDLLEGMLIYQNWVYLLPTRFPAGATLDDVDRLRQKNFRWQLSRQRALESSSEGESWDVTRTDQPKRLAEMLMFHDAVGGNRYTGLRHEVLSHLDFSDLLTEDRCLLVGRCRDPWTDVRIADADESVSSGTSGPNADTSDATPGETMTWVRVLMPVQEVRR